MDHIRNVAQQVSLRGGIAPQVSAAATVTSPAAIDRWALGNPQSALLRAHTGAVTGAPSAISVVARLQHSDDGVGGWANFGADAPTINAANAEAEVAVDLSGARRFLRVQTVIGFTGGTTPTIAVAAPVVFGGAERLPAP